MSRFLGSTAIGGGQLAGFVPVPVPNAAPVWTSGLSVSFTEATTGTVYVCAASDGNGNTLTYTIEGGVDAARFAITGANIRPVIPLNYEVPTDSGANNVYDLVLGVSDGQVKVTRAVALTVLNSNEYPTGLRVDARPGFTNLIVPENTPVGTVIADLVATDSDVGDSFTYAKYEGGDARFDVSGPTIVVAAPINFENGPTEIRIYVGATDAGGLTLVIIRDLTISNVLEVTLTGVTVTPVAGLSGTQAAGTVLANITGRVAGDTIILTGALAAAGAVLNAAKTQIVAGAGGLAAGDYARVVTQSHPDAAAAVANSGTITIGSSLPALAAITGERASGGVHLGFDNALLADGLPGSGRGISLPSGALKLPVTATTVSDWTIFIEAVSGSAAMPTQREMIATIGAGNTTNPPSSAGCIYRVAGTRRLWLSRRTANVNVSGEFITGSAVAVDLGITWPDHTAGILSINQNGAFPRLRLHNTDLKTLIGSYDGPDNLTTAPNYYKDNTGAIRALSNFADFFTTVGSWGAAATTVSRQGWAGTIGQVAMSLASYSDAQLLAIASGATSIGSL